MFKQYRDAGLCVIPLKKGKPVVKWKAYQNKLPDDVSSWNKYEEYGLVCGAISNVVAIDFDIDDAAIIKKVEDIAGVSPVKKLGSKGFTAFYKYNGEKTNKWFNGKIEFLSDKHLTTIPPSKHREKELFYKWIGAELIGTELPSLPENFSKKMNFLFSERQKHSAPKDKITASKIELSDAERMLTYISPDIQRDEWVKVGMALRNEYGDKASELWHKWSEKSPKYNANDARSAWLSFHDSGITIGTLIHMAKEAGWRQESKQYSPALLPEVGTMAANSSRTLNIGSDVEIAGRVREDLERKFGEIIHTEGECWRYTQTHWEPIPEHELRLAVHVYDGAYFMTAAEQPSRVKLNKSHVDSTINELRALITVKDFFAQNKIIGINCVSGFIHFAVDGTHTLEPHSRDHRCRHVLPGHWQEGASCVPPEGSMLYRLISGIFLGDEDAEQKIDLLAEACGSTALGYATKLRQPRALVLFGATAENGKGQVLDVMRGVVPASAVSNVPPSSMGDDRHIIGLVGKLLNATDELSSSKAISSDTFKTIITGEPVQGRDVYKPRQEFRPVAQHALATNILPAFEGGMDRGVQRRLLPIVFNRVIPLSERVENIGLKIAEQEADLLLAWTVGGASRLIRQGEFTIPPSSKDALNEWIFGADLVLAWASEFMLPGDVSVHKIRTREIYAAFRSWAINEGYDKLKIPPINCFVQRIRANIKGIEYRRTSEGRFFLGIKINR